MSILCCYILEAIYASAPRTVRGKPAVLKADLKGKKLLYSNGTSIFIRDIEVCFFLLMFFSMKMTVFIIQRETLAHICCKQSECIA